MSVAVARSLNGVDDAARHVMPVSLARGAGFFAEVTFLLVVQRGE
jgi:hypothetical protein